MEEAGYNPALALGDVNSVSAAGDVSVPNQPDNPRSADYFSEPYYKGGLDSVVSSSLSAMSQLEAIRGQQKDNAEKDIKLGWSEIHNRNQSRADDAMVRQMETGILLDQARIETQNQLTKVNERLAELHEAQKRGVEQDIKVGEQAVLESEARVTNLDSQTTLNQALTGESGVRVNKMNAEIFELEKRAGILQKDLDWYDRMKKSNIDQAISMTGYYDKSAQWVGRQPEPYWLKPNPDGSPGPQSSFSGGAQYMMDLFRIGK